MLRGLTFDRRWPFPSLLLSFRLCCILGGVSVTLNILREERGPIKNKDVAVTSLLQAGETYAQVTVVDFWEAGRMGLLRCLSTVHAAGAELFHTARSKAHVTPESLKSWAARVSARATIRRSRAVSTLNAKLEILQDDWHKLQALCSRVSVAAQATAAALLPTSSTFLEGLVLDAADTHAFDHITASQWSLWIDFQILWVMAAFSLVGISMPHLTL